ncbi:nuclear transport factor 2 family protein [Acrocarpospora catenulata]|uniref:nuclear transport factor 2 family protein n=1 Tax=Acrocarpospora catenulata TaxID=2836182 RepID=UPI001BDA7254|nr:nuclear transport factor 2 family protein [Acrocarpospora catenulata]
MSDLSHLDRRLRLLEERNHVAELLAEYCRAVDEHDPEAFADLWTADAVQDIRSRGTAYRGRDQIMEGLESTFAAFRHTHHVPGNLQITFVSDARADVRSDVTVHCVTSDGAHVVVAASYQDQVVREDGRWRFSSRVVLERLGGPRTVPATA